MQDIKNVANKRWSLVQINLIDTIMQGESAKNEIAKNIKLADELNFDIIIMAKRRRKYRRFMVI